MVQLYVYDDAGSRLEVNLYREEPIKITLSAENLEGLEQVDSAFSRTFRIPANQNNSKVFKWWYEVNTVDFDVTQKVRAEIHVDGLQYKSGHVRINSAYINGTRGNVDLELIFFGETRDFSTQIGEGLLEDLNLGHLAHKLTTDNIQKSWLPLTDANVLVGGGIRYILADRGYEYEELNNELRPTLSEIAGDDVGQYNYGFTKSVNPITLGQFTPMIQVKEIVDAIFDATEYTYSADSIFTEDWFKDLYTDGLPEGTPETAQTNGDFEAGAFGNLYFAAGAEFITPFTIEYIDNANTFNPSTRRYVAVETDTITFDATVEYGLQRFLNAPSPTITTRIYKNGVAMATDTHTTAVGVTPVLYTATLSQAISVVPGDEIFVTTQINQGNQHSIFPQSRFSASGVSLTISANNLIKKQVKQLDFLRSLLTKFKLIMAPSVENEKEFVIQPYKDYIGSGDRLDWTEKLDVNKDVTLEPIFFDRSKRINFIDQEDVDKMNQQHQDTQDRVYGELFFDSQNELLKETRKVETIFAPTPVNQMEGADPNSEFIIPFFCKHEAGVAYHGHAPHEPITPKPRLLFWNGLHTVAVTEGWYYEGANDAGINVKIGPVADYPRMSYLSEIQSVATTLNLNWFREFAYFEITGGPAGQLGESVYERYWNTYVQSLYSPLARKMTAYFTIDAQDLRVLSFNDLIFIQNAYWRVLKVYDAPLTDIATVKVDLVKILDEEIFANSATPTESGGGIDNVIVTGGGGSPIDTEGTWGANDNNFGDDDATWGGTSYYYHTVQACDNPGDTFTTRHHHLIAIGDSVKMSGATHVDVCYEVIAHVTGPEDTIVLETFPDCFSCNE